MTGGAARSLSVVAAFVVCSAMFATPVTAQLACRTDQKSTAVVELMFGRKIGKRIGVNEAAWMRFVDRELTPRFPNGLTIVDAAGQWLDPVRKRVVREPSKIVTIVIGDPEADRVKIDTVTEAYKKRFRQQAVGVIVRPACVSFQ
ncbi:MAG: DUF3574 domain-containing protein [Alphaproteobacteria bacterium]|nr:hypothetical protein [Pseudorhodoplanes sp.]MCQ3943505.1 DUF3574 domain-containing protein [Alphaproteobacteria bacterium]GIK79547.1 MAG: hypothetical protein BroJett024_06520 [Alphaproteobacteria bacterium]